MMAKDLWKGGWSTWFGGWSPVKLSESTMKKLNVRKSGARMTKGGVRGYEYMRRN